MNCVTGGVKQDFVRYIFSRLALLSLTTHATFLLFVSLSSIVLVVYAIAEQMDKPDVPNPFTVFADVLPGQFMDTAKLEAQGFSCRENVLPSPADIDQDCTRALPTGLFSHIRLTLWDGVVHWLDLKVRENELSVGDLTLWWGIPKIRIEGICVQLNWPTHHVTGLGFSYNGQFTYFQGLSHITFAV